MQKPVYWFAVMMVAWTLTSFMCHYMAKQYLRVPTVNTKVFICFVKSLIITSTQMAFCALCTTGFKAFKSTNKNFRLVVITHVLATLATNFSMALTFASSTFAIKLMEPITGAVAQRVILGNKLTGVQYSSLPAIVIGSVLFAEDLSSGFTISLGSLFAFLSNILLAVRNVIIKKEHMSDGELAFRKSTHCYTVVTVCVLVLLGSDALTHRGVLPDNTVIVECYIMLSAFFHIAYSYISTMVILKRFSVVGHAICNIVKRLVVVGLLFTTGRRALTAGNIYGLVVCTGGLIVYTASKTQAMQTFMKLEKRTSSTTGTVSQRLGSVKQYILLLMVVMFTGTLSLYGRGPIPGAENTASSIQDLYRRSGQWLQDGASDPRHYGPLLGSLTLDVRDAYLSKRFYVNDSVNNLPRQYESYKPTKDFPPPMSMEDALKVDLVENPDMADAISPYLTSRVDVVAEAQRIHHQIFTKLLAGRKKAMLFHYSPSENKGDSAIAVGEFIFLRKLHVELIYVCPLEVCSEQMAKAVAKKGKLTNKELVILFHGGGNVIGYPKIDKWRDDVMQKFPDFDIIMFPQSIYFNATKEHIDYCKKLYASHNSLTFLWRDRVTYKLGKELFPNVRALLSPDIAYEIGNIPRTIPPAYQVMWIKRGDTETPGYERPEKSELTKRGIMIGDWLKWTTPKGNTLMETTFLMTEVGLIYLQRGRMVITDRLHGHILSTLLGIPHVFIDNTLRKISNYHNTWTRGIENLVYTNSSTEAMHQADIMLKKLDKSLPPIIGYY